MNKLFLLSFFSLSLFYGFAQDDICLMLKGEWYYSGLTRPAVNDTFRICRNKMIDSYIKWEFRENKSFYEQIITEVTGENDSGPSMFIMDANVPSVWLYNKELNTIELKDLSRKYKITGINEKFLDLVRVK